MSPLSCEAPDSGPPPAKRELPRTSPRPLRLLPASNHILLIFKRLAYKRSKLEPKACARPRGSLWHPRELECQPHSHLAGPWERSWKGRLHFVSPERKSQQTLNTLLKTDPSGCGFIKWKSTFFEIQEEFLAKRSTAMLSQIPTHLHLRGLPMNPRTQESRTPRELSAKPPPHGPRPASPSAGSWACPPGVSATACMEGTLLHRGELHVSLLRWGRSNSCLLTRCKATCNFLSPAEHREALTPTSPSLPLSRWALRLHLTTFHKFPDT